MVGACARGPCLVLVAQLAARCCSFNSVDLPDYGSFEMLRTKFMQAIAYVEEGIGLS